MTSGHYCFNETMGNAPDGTVYPFANSIPPFVIRPNPYSSIIVSMKRMHRIVNRDLLMAVAGMALCSLLVVGANLRLSYIGMAQSKRRHNTTGIDNV
jgi:hypothetical protein